MFGESSEFRPRNLPGKSRVLCLLSYRFVKVRAGIEPAQAVDETACHPVPYGLVRTMGFKPISWRWQRRVLSLNYIRVVFGVSNRA